eukprot:s1292_g10.t1
MGYRFINTSYLLPAHPNRSPASQVYLSAEKVLLSTAEWTPPVSWCSVENVPTTGRIKVTYRGGKDTLSWSTRKKLYEQYGHWQLQTAANAKQHQDVNWWSSLNEAPVEVTQFLQLLLRRFKDFDQAFTFIDGVNGNGVINKKELTERRLLPWHCRTPSASFASQWALPDLNGELPIPVGNAGPQPRAPDPSGQRRGPQRRAPDPSGQRRTSTASSGSQWATPDLNRELWIPVGNAGLNRELPIPVGTAGPQRRAPDPSGQRRTSTASSRSQWALPDLNREPQSPVGNAGPQLRAPDRSVGFKPRSKPERELMNHLLRNLDSLDISFDVLFQEIIPAIRLGFAEIRSSELSKRFHAADADKSGTLSLSELLSILRWSGYFPKMQHVIQVVSQVVPELAESFTTSSYHNVLEKDILVPAQFHILAPLLEERSDSEYIQRRIEIADAMDLDDYTQQLWGQSLVDLHDVFLRRAKHDLLPFHSLLHLAVDCGLVQHRGPGFTEKLRSIAADEVTLQLVDQGYDFHDSTAVDRAHFDFRQVLRIMTQIREIENELIADVFAATDSDSTNGLSVEECMDCLESCGIRATSKQMQEIIPKLVEEFDEDGSGELDLDEYLEFAKFVADRIRKMQHVGRMETAGKLGYTDDEYIRLWDAFVAMDHNMDGMLEELAEMLQAVWASRPEVSIDANDIRAILKDQGIGYWKQEIKLSMNDYLLIVKDVERLHLWRSLGEASHIEKDSVESFIGFWRSLSRNMKEDTVTAKELTKAVKTLPGGAVKMARVRTLQQAGIEAIDFSHFLQVMKVRGSELGDGDFLPESDYNSPPGPLSPHEHLSSPSKSSNPAGGSSSLSTNGRIKRGERQIFDEDP